jgi:hypothetical protein
MLRFITIALQVVTFVCCAIATSYHFLEVWNSDAIVWAGEREGKAWIENRENIQDIGVDVLIRLQKREVRKNLIFMTGLANLYPICWFFRDYCPPPLYSSPLRSPSLQIFTM